MTSVSKSVFLLLGMALGASAAGCAAETIDPPPEPASVRDRSEPQRINLTCKLNRDLCACYEACESSGGADCQMICGAWASGIGTSPSLVDP